MNKYRELAKKLNLISDKDVCCEEQCEGEIYRDTTKEDICKSQIDSILCLSELLSVHYRSSQHKDKQVEEMSYEMYLLRNRIEHLEYENSMLKSIIDELTKKG